MAGGAWPLDTWLPAEIYRFGLVFCRVAMALLLLPGFGEASLPTRVRIGAGLLIAACIAPLAGATVPVPGGWTMLGAMAAETIAGALLGTLSRLLLSAIQTAGQIAGQCIGISNAFAFGIGMDNSAILGAMLYAGCLAALFALDGHHPALRALVDSYHLVPLGTFIPAAATARTMTEAFSTAFRLSLQLAMPFLLLSVLYSVALAGINRAIPAMPVFMVGAPALLMVGLYMLAATIPSLASELLGAYGDVFVLGR